MMWLLLVLAFVYRAETADIPEKPGYKEPDGVRIFSASNVRCAFSSLPTPENGVRFIHDTASKSVFYTQVLLGKVVRVEKLRVDDASNLLRLIDSMDFNKMDFAKESFSLRLAKAKREGRSLIRTDGCLDRLEIATNAGVLEIQGWHIFWEISQLKDEDPKMRKLNNLNEAIYSILGRMEMEKLLSP